MQNTSSEGNVTCVLELFEHISQSPHPIPSTLSASLPPPTLEDLAALDDNLEIKTEPKKETKSKKKPLLTFQIKNEDGETITVDERGIEVMSDDGSDDGSDLQDFVVDDEDLEDNSEKDEEDEEEDIIEIDPVILELPAKRKRKSPERYVDPDYLRLMCRDKKDAKVLLGKSDYKTAKKSGVPISEEQAKAKRKNAKRAKLMKSSIPEDEEGVILEDSAEALESETQNTDTNNSDDNISEEASDNPEESEEASEEASETSEASEDEEDTSGTPEEDNDDDYEENEEDNDDSSEGSDEDSGNCGSSDEYSDESA